jgi:hypothetical protein
MIAENTAYEKENSILKIHVLHADENVALLSSTLSSSPTVLPYIAGDYWLAFGSSQTGLGISVDIWKRPLFNCRIPYYETASTTLRYDAYHSTNDT